MSKPVLITNFDLGDFKRVPYLLENWERFKNLFGEDDARKLTAERVGLFSFNVSETSQNIEIIKKREKPCKIPHV